MLHSTSSGSDLRERLVRGLSALPDAITADAWEAFLEAKGAYDPAVAKRFFDYVLSKEFQEAFVEKNGFIPVSRVKK